MTGANTGYIASIDDLKALTDKVLADGLPISLDCELGYEGEDRSYRNTSPSLHPEENVVAGFSFTNSASWARYVPVGHDGRSNLDPAETASCLWKMASSGLCVVHNADAEERNLSRFMAEHLPGDEVQASRGYFPLRSDTMMECHALALWKSIALKSLAREVFDYNQTELKDLFSQILGVEVKKKMMHSLRFNVLDPTDPRVFGYACDDVIQTLRLHQRHYDLVKGPPDGPGSRLIYWLEMNVWPVIWEMEDTGLAIDWDFIDEARGRARSFRDKMQMDLNTHLIERLGRQVKFNPNSFPQVGKFLYDPPPDGLGLKTHIMTKGKADGTGKKMSTNAIALKGLSDDPFVKRMQRYRGMSKLLTTYLEHWREEYGWSSDGRAHCHLLPHGAVTGRTSSSDFNYQNLPKKYHYEVAGAEFNFNFRNSVIVRQGCWGMGFDLSQGELRIIAAEAGETAMLEAFARGEDLHSLTASRLLGISLAEVAAGGELAGVEYPADKGGFRPFGKTMNFALGYQLTVQGLADRLGCSLSDAEDHFARFFAAYPAIAAWTRRTVADSHVTGFTVSRFGRRHPIWDYQKNNCYQHQIAEHGCWKCQKAARQNQAKGERTAGNAPIQGGLADLMKLIMIRTAAALKQAGLKHKVRLMMNVHDALEYEVDGDVDPQLVIDTLTPEIIRPVPWTAHWPVMKPDWHIWTKWGEQVELDLDENYQLRGTAGLIETEMQEDEEDEDSEDEDSEEPAFRPPVSIAAAARVAGEELAVGIPRGAGADPDRPDSHSTHSGHVLVRVAAMPELDAVRRLMTLLREFPGPNLLTLVLPEGSKLLSNGTALSPAEAGRISLIIPGAQVVWDTATVDYSALAAGLVLLREVGHGSTAGHLHGLCQGEVRRHAGRD